MRWWVLLLTGAALCTAMLAAALAPSPSPTENRLGDPAPVPNSAVHHGPAAIATLCISWALFALFAARGVLALGGSPERKAGEESPPKSFRLGDRVCRLDGGDASRLGAADDP